MGAIQLNRTALRDRVSFLLDENLREQVRASAEQEGVSVQVYLEAVVTWAVTNSVRVYPAVLVEVNGKEPELDAIPFRTADQGPAARGILRPV